jgi:hypothetical protein
MVALEGEKEKDCFLVGTLSLRGVRDLPRAKQSQDSTPFLPQNDVQLLEFNEDNGEVLKFCRGLVLHPLNPMSADNLSKDICTRRRGKLFRLFAIFNACAGNYSLLLL